MIGYMLPHHRSTFAYLSFASANKLLIHQYSNTVHELLHLVNI